MTEYLFFYSHTKGENTCFSNFYESNFEIKSPSTSILFNDDLKNIIAKNVTTDIDKMTKFNCTEKYMMSMKALLFGDVNSYNKILNSKKPSECKSLGRLVKNFDEKTWNMYRYDIMKNGLCHKFNQNEDIKIKLKNTGDKILVEASSNDRIWGIGFSEKDALANKSKWGENLLGKAMCDIRDNHL